MSNTCPFGPELQKYWDRRHVLFSHFDEGIQTDAEGLFSVCPEDAALEIARKTVSSTILDAFGGVGGNAIAFARAGKRVWCTDTNPERLRMAEHNARVYGVSNKITFLNEDFFSVNCPAHAVFLDPPWGGPSYSQKEHFLLSDFSPDGSEMLASAFGRFSEVILRIPKNFLLSELEKLNRPFTIYDNHSNGKLVSRTVHFARNQ